MNFSLKLATATLALMSVAGVASADSGNPAMDTADATVTVVEPISVTANDDLNFGNIVHAGVAGTVVIDATTGARTLNTVDNGPGGNTPGRATFGVTADNAYTYNVSVTDTDLTFGATTLLLTTSVSSSNPVTGDGTIGVGGTLAIPAAAPVPGVYSGTVTLTAVYN